MRLINYRVREYRSVLDSDEIRVGDVTCLVGKNELGKTSLLRALYNLNPYLHPYEIATGGYDLHMDYPRRTVGDYENEIVAGKRKPAIVVTATFELDDIETDLLTKEIGPQTLKSRQVIVEKDYTNTQRISFRIDESSALEYINSSEFDEDRRAKFLETGVTPFLENKFNEWMPKFLYFDEYNQIKGQENIKLLQGRIAKGQLEKPDYPLLGLLKLAVLQLEDCTNPTRTVIVFNKLEAASNRISQKIRRYWSQNRHLSLRMEAIEGRGEDPEHLRGSMNLWARVHDRVHAATTEMSSRSKGFLWFFSFLSWYESVKTENLILLLDEPGLSLHGLAQSDLLRYMEEELKPNHQVIYTTHSSGMINGQQLDRVRIVQDSDIDSNFDLDELSGTKVLHDIHKASNDSLFPLQAALGYDISQSLFIAPNTIIVEGASDLDFLQAMSKILVSKGKEGLDREWVILYVGGGTKVSTFVSLLAPQRGMNVVTLTDYQKRDQTMLENLYKDKLLNKKKVLTYSMFARADERDEADIEDMFDRQFYLDLVNSEYQLDPPLTLANTNSNKPRIMKAVEEAMEALSHPFSHYRPARNFRDNADALSIDDPTLDRFEKMFSVLNSLKSSN